MEPWDTPSISEHLHIYQDTNLGHYLLIITIIASKVLINSFLAINFLMKYRLKGNLNTEKEARQMKLIFIQYFNPFEIIIGQLDVCIVCVFMCMKEYSLGKD